MKIYHTETQEDYDALMVELSSKYKTKLRESYWSVHKNQTVVFLKENNNLTFGNLIEAQSRYTNVTIIEYNANQNDPVNNPTHYTQGERETIENIRDTMSSEGYQGYCVGNVLKYLARYKFKNGVEDVKKAKKYIEFLIEELEE